MSKEKKISIDIHGFRALEAKNAIEDHILDCINQNYSQVRIVHGHGAGVLKRITEEVLTSSEFIKDFFPDHTFGVTIGNLKY
jgi:DNA mismatch repair protein MutS2